MAVVQYTFGDPFIVSLVEAALWDNTVSVANLANNVQIYGFVGLTGTPLNYSAVPILLITASW
ncbi:MAG: hypothetical protein WBZ42_09280 [Halobacteriota archaeon]